MTKQELNKDVKRLRKRFDQWLEGAYHDPDDLGKEWKRLYYADREFEYFTIKSMRDMCRMWSSLRPVPAHTLFSSIK